jgi:Flp pilus assembly pilin Flp
MQLFKHSQKMNSKKVTGQGMSEYLIIVGLLAVAGIAVMGLMGGTVRNQFGGMAQELAGNNGSGAIANAAGRASAAASTANTQRTLSNYSNQAGAITGT